MTKEEAIEVLEGFVRKGTLNRVQIAACVIGAASIRVLMESVAGAEAMREAAANVADGYGDRLVGEQIRALLLRESEVPEAVRAWCERWDGPGVAGSTRIDFALRDWIRKEYGK